MTNLPSVAPPPPDKRVLEWMRQADYDFDTALDMMKSKRYIYAVFMCHLSIEKALKGLYQHILQTVPPKTHSLTFLIN
jgi:HEPN domain-containing protein